MRRIHRLLLLPAVLLVAQCRGQNAPWQAVSYPNPKEDKAACKIPSRASGAVCDPDEVLGDDDRLAIDSRAYAIKAETDDEDAADCRKTGVDINVAVAKKIASGGAKARPAEMEEFAAALVAQWEPAGGDGCDKVAVVLLSLDDQSVWLQANGELRQYLSASELSDIAKSAAQLGHMKNGRYKEAVLGWMDEVKDKYAVDSETAAPSMPRIFIRSTHAPPPESSVMVTAVAPPLESDIVTTGAPPPPLECRACSDAAAIRNILHRGDLEAMLKRLCGDMPPYARSCTDLVHGLPSLVVKLLDDMTEDICPMFPCIPSSSTTAP